MSIYGTVQSEMTDIDRLAEACRRAGLGDRVLLYPNRDGVYSTWHDTRVRGRDAALVIKGGLDTKGNLCGDTAFVIEGNGTIRAEIDVAHGNAPAKLELIKNFYQLIPAERKAQAMGHKIELTVCEESGKITGRIIQGRSTAGRTQARRNPGRPVAGRPMAVRR